MNMHLIFDSPTLQRSNVDDAFAIQKMGKLFSYMYMYTVDRNLYVFDDLSLVTPLLCVFKHLCQHFNEAIAMNEIFAPAFPQYDFTFGLHLHN